jgi:hypothetical protein
MSTSLIGRQALSDYPPLQYRCRSRARASLRTPRGSNQAKDVVGVMRCVGIASEERYALYEVRGRERFRSPKSRPSSSSAICTMSAVARRTEKLFRQVRKRFKS